MSTEALKQALEALEDSRDDVVSALSHAEQLKGYARTDARHAAYVEQLTKHDAAIEALRTTLTQATASEGEPDDTDPFTALDECARILETRRLMGDGVRCEVAAKNARAAMRKLYTAQHAPAARPISPDALKALMVEAGYVNVKAQEKADFISGFRHAEVHHRIGSQPTAPAVPAQLPIGMTREQFAYSLYCAQQVDAATAEIARLRDELEIARALLSAAPAAVPAVPEVTSPAGDWTYSHDGERYSGQFATRDEALAEAASCGARFIGRVRHPEDFISKEFLGDSIEEAISERLGDEVGEVAENFSLNRRQREDLGGLVLNWIIKGPGFNCWGVEDVEEIASAPTSTKGGV